MPHDGAEVIVLVDGMAPGMPLGPPVRLPDLPLYISVYGGAHPPPDPAWANAAVVAVADLPGPAQAAVRRTIAEHLGDRARPPRRPPWYGRGWLEKVDAWIDERLGVLGLTRGGASAPVRVWSLSAVLRVPLTGGGSVWFKAACEHFRTEPSVTRVVAAIAPTAAPTVLATEDDRAWMLLSPLPPTTLDGGGRVTAAAEAMVDLHLRSSAHVGSLLTAGCPDRGFEPTRDAFIAIETDGGSASGTWTRIEERLAAFFHGGPPPCLVHGDLHLGNVAGDEQPVIYDWTDACISHPFLDGMHLARVADGAHHDAVRDIYLAAFGEHERPTWDLAALADRVFQAVTFAAIGRSLEPDQQWEMSGEIQRQLARLESEYAGRG